MLRTKDTARPNPARHNATKRCKMVTGNSDGHAILGPQTRRRASRDLVYLTKSIDHNRLVHMTNLADR